MPGGLRDPFAPWVLNQRDHLQCTFGQKLAHEVSWRTYSMARLWKRLEARQIDTKRLSSAFEAAKWWCSGAAVRDVPAGPKMTTLWSGLSVVSSEELTDRGLSE